jgi:hypothetical protein
MNSLQFTGIKKRQGHGVTAVFKVRECVETYSLTSTVM